MRSVGLCTSGCSVGILVATWMRSKMRQGQAGPWYYHKTRQDVSILIVKHECACRMSTTGASLLYKSLRRLLYIHCLHAKLMKATRQLMIHPC